MVVPGPACSSWMRPPWASTIERQMASPIPSPLGLVVKNGSKRRFFVVGVEARSGVGHVEANAGVVPGTTGGPYPELTPPGRDGLHRIGSVDQQIHQNLL